MNLEFLGTNALLLGGTCELALDLARHMTTYGLVPMLTYRNPQGLERINKSFSDSDKPYKTYFLDLNDLNSIYALFENLTDRLDYMVDFAHSELESLVASVDDNESVRYFMENVAARSIVIKYASRAMLKNKFGRLLYISSTAALRPNIGQGFYSASKLASEALYKNIGLELGSKGITSLILRPGYIDAGRGRLFLSQKNAAIDSIPLKRLVSIRELTEIILFFISKNSNYINSTDIVIDGGLSLSKSIR